MSREVSEEDDLTRNLCLSSEGSGSGTRPSGLRVEEEQCEEGGGVTVHGSIGGGQVGEHPLGLPLGGAAGGQMEQGVEDNQLSQALK